MAAALCTLCTGTGPQPPCVQLPIHRRTPGSASSSLMSKPGRQVEGQQSCSQAPQPEDLHSQRLLLARGAIS